MKDSLDVLIAGTEELPPGGRDVAFQLGETLLPGTFSSEDDELGSDIVGNGGTNDPLVVLAVGIEVLPPEGREVMFQLGDKLLPVVAFAEDERLGNDTVGNGTNDTLKVLIVGTDTLPPDGREVLFQLGPRLLPEVISAEEGFSEVEALIVGDEVLPPGRDVLFQLGPTLLPEVSTPEDVGKGTKVPLEVLVNGTDVFPPKGRDVLFQLGPKLLPELA
jgi:hypothetical protein